MTLDPLAQSPQQFNQMTDAVNAASGSEDLKLESNAAALAAQACAQMLSSIQDATLQVMRVESVNGIGFFETDTTLKTQRLDKKGTGTDDSLDKILNRHKELLMKLRDLYIKAGNAYQDTEFEGKKKFDHVDFGNLTFDQAHYDSTTDHTTTDVGVKVK